MSLLVCGIPRFFAIALPSDVLFAVPNSSTVQISITPTGERPQSSSITAGSTEVSGKVERSDRKDPDCNAADGAYDGPDTALKPSYKHWCGFPQELLYRSYIAGEKNPRFSSVWLYETGVSWIWESALGGRFPMLNYGTGDLINPEGWQLDLKEAPLPG